MKKIVVCFLLVLNFGCTDNDDNELSPEPFTPVAITPTLIGKNNLNGSEGISQQTTVITNETDWNTFKNEIDSYYQPFGINYTEDYFSETTIDFTSYTVIVIFDQVYGNGGHTIDITDITEYEETIIVTVENLQTGNATSIMTQPYHIVKIPLAAKPIVFE
ncbi:hypothetical protein FLJC2902T_22290 [Flavobacterium limnosediminis JC2902]|uniref:PrcB C-terminal domain-containing protein n=1 Tax=Flavobacterium limnosediminis JC2902 TaxID=1341181 RepID=V6SKJ0_9FLAO|nr:protease complex subunit PrcB family protein [Flavobacterium limnosediminis]ESU27121.1 hypothetical protein FLJC2902T_22290 [Flavobacterium limnosediminis JC2902]